MQLDPQLSLVARKHSKAMAGTRELFHSAQSTLARRVTRWRMLGENVGVGPNVTSLHRAFMHSTLHRQNILRPSFRHVGVAVASAAGQLWVTAVFESRRDPGTTLSMPTC